MPIDVSCAACHKSYSVPDERAGQRFRCRQCGTSVQVPGGYGMGFQDSGNQYASWDNPPNPFDAPQNSGYRFGAQQAAAPPAAVNARSRTLPVAICLYVIVGLSVIYHVGEAILAFANNGNPGPFGGGAGFDPDAQIAIAVIRLVVCLLLDILTLVGAISMHRLTSWGLALTGAIAACIPCCGPCFILGIPFGIWGIVVLSDQQVRRAFR